MIAHTLGQLIAALEGERRALVSQMKRSLRDHGEGRRLNQIDKQLASLKDASAASAAIAKATGAT